MAPITEAPNRIPWPPILLVSALAAGFALEAAFQTTLAPIPLMLGAGIVAVALGFDAWAMVTMARARTNILPHRSADRLVTWGPFALTRNPIYVGNVLLLAGIGVAVDSAWLLAAAVVDGVLTHHLAVRREERHLASLFGDDWTRYAARIPRWIGLPRATPRA